MLDGLDVKGKVLNALEIEEISKKAVEHQREDIKKYHESGDYTDLPFDFGNLASWPGTISAVEALLMLYDEIPDKQKYQIVFDVYTNLKSPAKDLKKLVYDVKKYRPNKNITPLKKKVDGNNNLTVFRGVGKKEKSPQLSLSWTLKKEVALFFARDYFITKSRTDTFYLYTGEINIDDVIHYTNGRKEFEIIQYRSVKNIREECLSNVNILG